MEVSRVEGPEPQSHLINDLAGAFAQDERIVACWLRGSFAKGTCDHYSDIDIAIAVDDEQFHYGFQSARDRACGSKIVMRSKPELVRQEFYGLMMAHFAVRGLMHEAALGYARGQSHAQHDRILPAVLKSLSELYWG